MHCELVGFVRVWVCCGCCVGVTVLHAITSDHPEVVAAVREALAEVGSTNPNTFELRFNVDILSPVVKHAESEVLSTHPHMRPCTDTHCQTH